MQTIIHLLAEDVWPVIFVLALVDLILAIAMYATGRGRYLAWMIVLAVAALGLLVVEWTWVTDGERVDEIVDRMASAARHEDIDELTRYLSPQCRFGPAGPNEIRGIAASVFQQFDINRVTLSRRKTEVSTLRKQAKTEFLAVAHARQNDVDLQPYPSRWLLTFHQTASGEWQVIDIQQMQATSDNPADLIDPRNLNLP